jgi:DNA polymerase-3 subunit alpha
MSFNHLHLHTNLGSRLDGIASSEDYAKRASELGHTSVAITDHGKLTGWYEHQVACKKHGVKPVFGLEQYVCPENTLEAYDAKKKRIRPQNNHLVLLAKNEIGYRNLMELHYVSMADGRHFYYNNHSSFEEVFKYKEGLIVGTACLGSPFANLLKEGKAEESKKLLDRFLEEFGDNMYAELQLNELIGNTEGLAEGQKTVNKFIKDWANERGVPIIITGDVHYLDKEDYIVQNIALALQSKKTVNDTGAFQLEGQTLFYHDIEDYKFFSKNWKYGYTDEEIETWCNNTQYIVDKCNYSIPERDRMILPEVYDDDEEEMEKLSKKGLCDYFSVSTYEECPEIYRKRLERELEVLKRKGFGSYAMILYDIFEFCKKEDIMRGPARGSAGGSLALFCLGITTLDPIKHDLIFERFLSDSRAPNVGYSYFKEL